MTGDDDLPEIAYLQSLLPRSKTDCQAVDLIAELGFPEVAPIVPELLEWLQDGNWPVAKRLAGWLASVGIPIVPYLDRVLASEDLSSTYWMIDLVISRSQPLCDHYRLWLSRCARAPTPLERQHEIDLVAREALQVLEGCYDRPDASPL